MPSLIPPSPYQRRTLGRMSGGEDVRSVMSASSGNSTLLDAASQRSNTTAQTLHGAASSAAQIPQFRKFTSAVGKPGQARETREAVSRALQSTANARPQPLAAPMDYEKFVSTKSVQLEHDKDRDLLLFPRDDVSESRVVRKERTAIPSVHTAAVHEAEWLLSRDALRHYSSPDVLINFNYSHFAGQFSGFDSPPQGLSALRFESDDERNNQHTAAAAANSLIDSIIKEGYLTLLPGEGLVDNFRGEKKRYCLVRGDEEGRVIFEVHKQALAAATLLHGPQQPLLSMEIKSAGLKMSKKGRYVLQISPNADSDKRTISLSSESSENELIVWQVEIERALTWNSNLVGSSRDDSAPVDQPSRSRSNSLQPNSQPQQDSDSLASDESFAGSYKDPNSGSVWRGRNAAAKALHPPIVERRSVFSLYWNFSITPGGETHNTLTYRVGKSPVRRKKSSPAEQSSSSSLSMSNRRPAYTDGRGITGPPRPSTSGWRAESGSRGGTASPTPSTSSLASTTDGGGIVCIAELKQLNIKLGIGGCPPEQIEPFYLRLFVYDASLGVRISEEFRVVVPAQSAQFEQCRRMSDGAHSLNFAAEIQSPPSGGKFNGISVESLLDQSANKKFLCPIPAPRPDVFLVVKVERLLSDVPADIYAKASAYSPAGVDPKTASKWIKSIAMASTKVGKRTLFAWSCRPIFPQASFTASAVTNPEWELPLYKSDGRLSDAELQKVLTDFARLEKSGKLHAIAGANITIRTECNTTMNATDVQMRVSPSLMPLRPWRPTPDSPLCFELQSFIEATRAHEPFSGYTNHLYVYPLVLNYGSQKVFSKARNIECRVSFLSGKRGGEKREEAIFDRCQPSTGPLVASYSCAVQYHNQNPQFNDEIKLQLPCAFSPHDHLLFEFKHIAVATALSPKTANEAFELPIGYAWLPLVKESPTAGFTALALSSDVQDFELPVAAHLPPGYVKYQPCNISVTSKEGGGTQQGIKFVENGKPLFKVRLRLVSTVFSTDEKIHSFFETSRLMTQRQLISLTAEEESAAEAGNHIHSSIRNRHSHSHSIEQLSPEVDGGDEMNEVGVANGTTRMLERLESLMNADVDHLFPFLHVVLNRLLVLITCAASDEIALNALNSTVAMVDRMMGSPPRADAVRVFIHSHARCHTSANASEETTHGALLKLIPQLLKSIGNETKALSSMLRQLWFLFELIAKFMAQWLLHNRLLKAPRRDRFPVDVLVRAGELIQALTTQIMLKHQELPTETRSANTALAVLINHLLSLADRHAVMKQLMFVVGSYDSSESRSLRVYKLELMQILAGHEHWIPLCLPLLTDRMGGVMRNDHHSIPSLSAGENGGQRGGFLSKFFAQIFTTYSAIQESTEADRYASYIEHFYLSESYCRSHFPLGLLLQELLFSLRDPRSYRKQVIRLVRNLLAKHCQDARYSDSLKAAQNRIAILYTPVVRIVVGNIAELEASVNEGSTEFKSPSDISLRGAKPVTLGASSSLLSDGTIGGRTRAAIHAQTLPLAVAPTAAGGSNDGASNAHHQRSFAISAFTLEKLDREETKDLLLCVLYLLNKLPKRALGALWCAQETIHNNDTRSSSSMPNEGEGVSPSPAPYLDFIRMMELTLHAFHYSGRAEHEREKEAVLKKSVRAAAAIDTNFNTARSSITMDGGGQFGESLPDRAHHPFHSVVNALNVVEEEERGSLGADGGAPTSFLQDCNLIQEVGLIVLEAVQTLAKQISARSKGADNEAMDAAFQKLLALQVQLLGNNWPEAVRLHALAALAVFINLFSARFFQHGPLDGLSTLLEALLLQLNSRLSRVQNSAAALLQLVLRSGFDAATPLFTKQQLNSASQAFQQRQPPASNRPTGSSAGSGAATEPNLVERLGRPGAQTGVALAHILGGKRSPLCSGTTRFERGLGALESLQVNHGDRRGSPLLFERAVLELLRQLRGVLEATSQLSEVTNDSCKAADLRIQLANSYRGSAALRCAWFDALAVNHLNEQWFSEAAVCQAHSIAIVAKELHAQAAISVDWRLFDVINDKIADEEGVRANKMESTQQGGYTPENFANRVEELVKTLVLSERYEAVGPVYRLAIPVYEQQHNYKALSNLYAEIQQACSRASEVKATGRRHLASYFRVVFHGARHFGDESGIEWVYREPRLTSLAEACDRLVEATRLSLGHDSVEILSERLDTATIDGGGKSLGSLDPTIAYIRVTHVEPCQRRKTKRGDSGKSWELIREGMDENDPMNYAFHTNIRTFVYDERVTDDSVPLTSSEQARQAARRVVITVERSFPNARRRQRVVERKEHLLSPLDLACDSLLLKTRQIQKVLRSAGIQSGAFGYDKASLSRLDVKQLQLYLQGAVSPSVNAGVLAYAEAFTAPLEKARYGEEGTRRLVSAFKTLIAELEVALRVNEAAMLNERSEYRLMLKNSWEGMLERLSTFFAGEKFKSEPGAGDTADGRFNHSTGSMSANSTTTMHVFDSIANVPIT